MKKIILMSMVALFVTGCKQKSSEDAYVINPDDAIDVRFEDVATDVRIVPLQSEEPIGGYHNLQCIGDEVMIQDNNDYKVYYFKNGKYQSTLNSVGRGPGEYTRIRSICYDTDRRVLYLQPNDINNVILQYSVPEMKYLGSLKTPAAIGSLNLYDDNTLMLEMSNDDGSSLYLYDINTQEITGKVLDLTVYQGSNVEIALGGFNKKSHLVSIFGTTNQLYNCTGQEIETVLKFNYGKMGVDYIYDAKIETNKELQAYFDYKDSHGNHFKDLYYPHYDDNGVSFWYNTLYSEPENSHYFRINGDKIVSLKGFKVPGITIPIVPTCITDNGYATIIEGSKDDIRDTDTPLSPFGQKIIDAMSSQNDNNPIIIYYNIGG